MNVVKVTKLNEDGSIAFEGFFPPEEAKVLLDIGVNYLLTNGMMAVNGEDEDDEDDIMDNFEPDENPPNRH
jgi:hypothetical protein